MHKAWSSIEEMPYGFPRSSIKFQGHTVRNITDFDPHWAFPYYRPVAAFKSLRFALFMYDSENITISDKLIYSSQISKCQSFKSWHMIPLNFVCCIQLYPTSVLVLCSTIYGDTHICHNVPAPMDTSNLATILWLGYYKCQWTDLFAIQNLAKPVKHVIDWLLCSTTDTADKRWVGPLKLLCIIMFDMSKIRPKSLLSLVKVRNFRGVWYKIWLNLSNIDENLVKWAILL